MTVKRMVQLQPLRRARDSSGAGVLVLEAAAAAAEAGAGRINEGSSSFFSSSNDSTRAPSLGGGSMESLSDVSRENIMSCSRRSDSVDEVMVSVSDALLESSGIVLQYSSSSIPYTSSLLYILCTLPAVRIHL